MKCNPKCFIGIKEGIKCQDKDKKPNKIKAQPPLTSFRPTQPPRP